MGPSLLSSVTKRYKDENNNKYSLFTLRCRLFKTYLRMEHIRPKQTYFNFRLLNQNVSHLFRKEFRLMLWWRVPFLALELVVTRVRSSTLPHLFPDLNPISLFSTILYAPPPTSFTVFLAVNVANFTSVNARHFTAANHSISDINVCAISPIFGANDSRKRHEKRVKCVLCTAFKCYNLHWCFDEGDQNL